MKPRACKICNKIYEEGDVCPKCGSKESTDSFKGRIIVINPEKLHSKLSGSYSLKLICEQDLIFVSLQA